jgi:hypothetical protein
MHEGKPFKLGADVPCGATLGYSNMSPLNQYLSQGELNPADLRVVREILPTSVNVTKATVTGSTLVFTTELNSLKIGDRVSVTGLGTVADNVNNVAVTAATATSFTIALPTGGATVGTGSTVIGKVVDTDTLNLPLAATNYLVEQLNVLPAGATSGFKITEIVPGAGATLGTLTGNSTIAYDVQMVSFAGLAATPLASLASAATNTGIASFSFTAVGGVVNAYIASSSQGQRFSPAVRNYNVVASTGATSIALAFTKSGTTNVTQLLQWLTPTSAPVITTVASSNTATIDLTKGRTFAIRINKKNSGPTDYRFTVSPNGSGLAPTFDRAIPVAGGFVTNVTNCDPLDYTYTASVVTGSYSASWTQNPNSTQCQIKVTGLDAGEASTLTVTATPIAASLPSLPSPSTGSITATAGSSLAVAPMLGGVTSTNGGFRTTLDNYDSQNYTYSAQSTAPGSASIDATDPNNVVVNVTGLNDGQTATLTVTATSKNGLGAESTSIVGRALQNTVAAPTLAAVTGYEVPTRVSDAVTLKVEITNYDAALNYGCDVLYLSGTDPLTLDNCVLSASGGKHYITLTLNVAGLSDGVNLDYVVVADNGLSFTPSSNLTYTVGSPGSLVVH